MTTYLTLTAELGCALGVLPGSAVKVFLALAGRSMEDGDLAITCQELAYQCDLTPLQVKGALRVLSGAHPKDYPDLPTLVKWGTKGGATALKVDPAWIGQRRRAILWSDASAEDRVPLLDAEVRRLQVALAQARTNDVSDVGRVLKGEDRDVAVEVEAVYGRALSPAEAFYLGVLIARFGPDRVKREIRAARSSRDPLRAAFARMRNGAAGKSAEQRGDPASIQSVNLREI